MWEIQRELGFCPSENWNECRQVHVFQVTVEAIQLRATQISLERGGVQAKIADAWQQMKLLSLIIHSFGLEAQTHFDVFIPNYLFAISWLKSVTYFQISDPPNSIISRWGSGFALRPAGAEGLSWHLDADAGRTEEQLQSTDCQGDVAVCWDQLQGYSGRECNNVIFELNSEQVTLWVMGED